MAAGAALRIITFLLHFASALFLLSVAFRCSNVIKTSTYTETVTDPGGYVVIMDATCSDPYSRECFFGLPQAYDTIQYGLSWNVFALLTAFEWLSASFALFYLDGVLKRWWKHANEALVTVCLVWNAVGIFTLMPYSMPMTVLQSGITTLALLTASASQATSLLREDSGVRGATPTDDNSTGQMTEWVIPSASSLTRVKSKGGSTEGTHGGQDSERRVIHHYTEYCTSASLLFVAVLILFVPDPVSWATLFGFTGVLICNASGIGAHNCVIDSGEMSAAATRWYDLDWTKCGNHFKLFLFHSWIALAASIGVIMYLSRDSLTSSDVPVWVRFILWNLLVTYTLFGVWASLCYGMAGARITGENFHRWMERLDYGLTVLSAAAKLPIAYTVFYGLIQQPDENVCSVQ